MSGTDLRIQKTYAALTREFTALLKEKRFEQITVKELCDAAMVRTATFYNHFSDKYEFADFVIRDALDSYRGDDSELQRLAGPEYYEQLLYHAFDLLENNRELLRSLASDSMLWSIGEVIRNSVHDELLTHLQRDQAADQTLAADPQLLTEFIIGAIEEVIRWWFSSSDPIPTEELKKQLVNSVLRLVSYDQK